MLLRAVILAAALAGLLVLVRMFDVIGVVEGSMASLRGMGVAGGLAYMLAYAVLACAFVPGSVMTMLAGATWGLGVGVLIIVPGATIATTISAWLGRSMLRGLTERILDRYPILSALDRVFGERAFRFVALLRLSPVMPFAASNYGLGATSAPIWAIAAGTFIGLIPITIVWAYLGTLAGDAVTTGVVPDSPVRTVFLVLGLAVTVFIVAWLGRLAKAQLQVSEI